MEQPQLTSKQELCLMNAVSAVQACMWLGICDSTCDKTLDAQQQATQCASHSKCAVT